MAATTRGLYLGTWSAPSHTRKRVPGNRPGALLAGFFLVVNGDAVTPRRGYWNVNVRGLGAG